jgi:hypothetical protein
MRRGRSSHMQKVRACFAGTLIACLSAPAYAQQPKAESAPSDVQSAAREAYAAGVAAFQHENYTEAADHFSRADALVESPSATLMLGRCLRQLGRGVEAYRVLEDTVRDADRSGSERYAKVGSAAQQELVELKRELAWLTVEIEGESGGATLEVQGRTVERSELSAPLPVQAGAVQVSLRGADGAEARRELSLEPAGYGSVRIRLPVPAPAIAAVPAAPAPTPRSASTEPPAPTAHRTDPLRNVGYAVGVVGVASLIGSGVLGVLSSADFAELKRECPGRRNCESNLQHVATRGESYQTAANIALGVGALAVAAGVSLFVIGQPDERPSLAVGPQGVRLQGGF